MTALIYQKNRSYLYQANLDRCSLLLFVLNQPYFGYYFFPFDTLTCVIHLSTPNNHIFWWSIRYSTIRKQNSVKKATLLLW